MHMFYIFSRICKEGKVLDAAWFRPDPKTNRLIIHCEEVPNNFRKQMRDWGLSKGFTVTVKRTDELFEELGKLSIHEQDDPNKWGDGDIGTCELFIKGVNKEGQEMLFAATCGHVLLDHDQERRILECDSREKHDNVVRACRKELTTRQHGEILSTFGNGLEKKSGLHNHNPLNINMGADALIGYRRKIHPAQGRPAIHEKFAEDILLIPMDPDTSSIQKMEDVVEVSIMTMEEVYKMFVQVAENVPHRIYASNNRSGHVIESGQLSGAYIYFDLAERLVCRSVVGPGWVQRAIENQNSSESMSQLSICFRSET